MKDDQPWWFRHLFKLTLTVYAVAVLLIVAMVGLVNWDDAATGIGHLARKVADGYQHP